MSATNAPSAPDEAHAYYQSRCSFFPLVALQDQSSPGMLPCRPAVFLLCLLLSFLMTAHSLNYCLEIGTHYRLLQAKKSPHQRACLFSWAVPEEGTDRYGTEGRSRTGTVLPPPDFESGASTSFATPALGECCVRIGRHDDAGFPLFPHSSTSLREKGFWRTLILSQAHRALCYFVGLGARLVAVFVVLLLVAFAGLGARFAQA